MKKLSGFRSEFFADLSKQKIITSQRKQDLEKGLYQIESSTSENKPRKQVKIISNSEESILTTEQQIKYFQLTQMALFLQEDKNLKKDIYRLMEKLEIEEGTKSRQMAQKRDITHSEIFHKTRTSFLRTQIEAERTEQQIKNLRKSKKIQGDLKKYNQASHFQQSYLLGIGYDGNKQEIAKQIQQKPMEQNQSLARIITRIQINYSKQLLRLQ